QRLTFPDKLVSGIGKDFLDPARKTHLDVGQPGFVHLDIADGANLILDRLGLYNPCFHADALQPLWRQLHGDEGRFTWAWRPLGPLSAAGSRGGGGTCRRGRRWGSPPGLLRMRAPPHERQPAGEEDVEGHRHDECSSIIAHKLTPSL